MESMGVGTCFLRLCFLDYASHVEAMSCFNTV